MTKRRRQPPPAAPPSEEIGRAAGRGKGEISVGAGSLKKKKKKEESGEYSQNMPTLPLGRTPGLIAVVGIKRRVHTSGVIIVGDSGGLVGTCPTPDWSFT